MTDTLALTTYSYLNDPTYTTIGYSHPVQIYYLICGSIAALGNLYLFVLFVKYPKLRATHCNWLIILLSVSDFLIGIGTVFRGLVNMIVIDNHIVILNFYFCTLTAIEFGCGYRLGQTIALMMALDRFIAIWRPTIYAKGQGSRSVVTSSIVISIIASIFITIMFVYGADFSQPVPLSLCTNPTGLHWKTVMPGYSSIISIVFFVTYVITMILFSRHVSYTKQQQAHTQKQMSKIQTKIFISVSISLMCYTVFYVIPTILNMLQRYFGLNGAIFDASTYFVVYGAEFNGCLNVLVYLIKHQEFKECSQKFIYPFIGKQCKAKSVTRVKTVTPNRMLK